MNLFKHENCSHASVEGAPKVRGCIDKILRKNISPKIKCKVWILWI
jgi:hypothetical protein